jgi:hypothetical protein
VYVQLFLWDSPLPADAAGVYMLHGAERRVEIACGAAVRQILTFEAEPAEAFTP